MADSNYLREKHSKEWFDEDGNIVGRPVLESVDEEEFSTTIADRLRTTMASGPRPLTSMATAAVAYVDEDRFDPVDRERSLEEIEGDLSKFDERMNENLTEEEKEEKEQRGAAREKTIQELNALQDKLIAELDRANRIKQGITDSEGKQKPKKRKIDTEASIFLSEYC